MAAQKSVANHVGDCMRATNVFGHGRFRERMGRGARDRHRKTIRTRGLPLHAFSCSYSVHKNPLAYKSVNSVPNGHCCPLHHTKEHLTPHNISLLLRQEPLIPLPPIRLLGRPSRLPPAMLSSMPSSDSLSTRSPVLSPASAPAPPAALPTSPAAGSSNPAPPKARTLLPAAPPAARARPSAADDSRSSINF